MANKLKISKTPTGNTGIGATRTDRATGPESITVSGVTGTPGSVGGVYTQSGAQIHPQVNTGNGATDGSMLRQKGAHKFLCTDGTTQKICTLVNNKTLTAGQMNIPVYTGTFSGNIADTAGAATSSYLRYQVSSLVGVAPTVGQVIHNVGQSITGTVTVTAVNATVGGYGNVTVAFASQDGDPPSGNYTMETGFYASRISNRWVSDFNNNKYRYWSQAPSTANKYAVDAAAGTTAFVQVPDAS
jgi:hypothetical protein